VKNDGKFEIGDPYVEGAVVKAEIVEDLKVLHPLSWKNDMAWQKTMSGEESLPNISPASTH
jgi:hypothetical protein